MQVILMERIEKLGQMGDTVTVKPGFARNFLLPQGKAIRATKTNLERFVEQRAQLEAENLERRQEAEQLAAKIEGLSVILTRQAGESGQLYGSVNAKDIAEAVTEAGFTINRKQVIMNAVIKALGLHSVKIRLHPEVEVAITVNVARSKEEAAAQAAAGRMVSSEELREAEAAAEAEIEAAVKTVEEADEATEDAREPSEEKNSVT